MIIIPAVDIKGGRCVQLVQGKPGTGIDCGDPVEAARRWEKEGAQLLHLVDLDAALGTGDNLKVVKEIKKAVNIPIQFGGGIRDEKRAGEVLRAGVDRIIIGTAAVKDPRLVKRLSEKCGRERIMVAVDSAGGRVVIKGWTEATGISTLELIKNLRDYVFGFLVTDVDREGLMKGIDAKEFELLNKTGCRICASGGITSQRDIKALERIGVWGCVVGRALYEGKVKLS